MKNNNIKILILLFSVVAFASCEKECVYENSRGEWHVNKEIDLSDNDTSQGYLRNVNLIDSNKMVFQIYHQNATCSNNFKFSILFQIDSNITEFTMNGDQLKEAKCLLKQNSVTYKKMSSGFIKGELTSDRIWVISCQFSDDEIHSANGGENLAITASVYKRN